ncbi:MAG: methionine adenosyltransferase [Phycisphaerae bacterium]|nr:methionine adenosyltransferase [Phycisphaerae bacterium]
MNGESIVPSRQERGLHLFTSESVSMGHPDKVADQISDALLDSLIGPDPGVRAAIETLVTTNYCLIAGEVTVHNPKAERALAEYDRTIRKVITDIGYTDTAAGFDAETCKIETRIHKQSGDISQGVTAGENPLGEQGAGDQGLMFGFACDETSQLMPLPIHLSHRLVEQQAKVRREGGINWLRPDAKSQVTVVYDGQRPIGIRTVVLSTQHTEAALDPKNDRRMSEDARREVRDKIIMPVLQHECPDLSTEGLRFHINPTGRFLTGGPDGDCGLTGRKVIVDTYGGYGRHGGGAFSGKDPSKVDRSAAYMARHVAKNIVAAGLARQCEVQLAYVIGVAEPVSVAVDTFGTGEVAEELLSKAIREVFPLKPAEIISYLELCRPVYFQTARHGHFGRDEKGFTWEKTDRVEDLRSATGALQAV